MSYEISLLEKHIDFAPETLLAEVSQNVRILFETEVNTCPYYRDFGIDRDILDNPMPTAMARFTSELVKKIKRYEPRVKVTQIDWAKDLNGKLQPRIKFRLLG